MNTDSLIDKLEEAAFCGCDPREWVIPLDTVADIIRQHNAAPDVAINALKEIATGGGTAAKHIKTAKAAIAAMNMGTDKAVKSSTEQEESVIVPEAAGLETECAQPVPATMEDASTRNDEEGIANAASAESPVLASSEIWNVYGDPQLSVLRILENRLKIYPTYGEKADAIYEIFKPYFRTTEPANTETNYWKTRYLLLEQKTKATKPVSVSLEKCARAAYYATAPSHEENPDYPEWAMITNS